MAVDEDDDDAVPRFTDQNEALEFWKDRAQKLQTTLRQTDSTLKEFEESSSELEKEMERELDAANGKARDMQVRLEQAKGDVDVWKSKYQKSITEHSKAMTDANRESSALRDAVKTYKEKLRDLELDNDGLENAERMVKSSLSDLELRYNESIERTAMLQEELIGKAHVEEENQRLKDELQEVKDELAILQDRASQANSRPTSARALMAVESSSSALSPNREFTRPPSSASSASASAAPSATARRFSHQPTLSSYARQDSSGVRRSGNVEGRTSSPVSSQYTRARQSLGPGIVRSSPSNTFVTASSTARLQPRTTMNSGYSSRVQPGASMKKMAGLLRSVRELQATVHSATRITLTEGQFSAIPRPASRLGTNPRPPSRPGSVIGHSSTATPRRRVEASHGTPSSIPVPSNAPGRSYGAMPRPSSSLRMHHTGNVTSQDRIPSSIRSQTPNLEQLASLDFLDQDPASNHAVRPGGGGGGAVTFSQSMMHLGSSGPGVRQRGSSISSQRETHRAPLRESTQSRPGQAAPPSAAMRHLKQSRDRSSSIGSTSNVG